MSHILWKTVSLALSRPNGRGALLWFVATLVAAPCAALPVENGTFDAGLTGWTSQGDVTAVTHASLGDDGSIYSLLYQAVALGPGSYRLEFDFLGMLAPSASAFPDTFYAALYFIDDPALFDLAATPPVFDDVSPLFDLDASGPSNVDGILSPSAIGGDWNHFAFNFTNNYAYGIPVFEFFDFDGIGDNGEVRIDNVSLSRRQVVIPEPATLALAAIGMAGIAAARRRGDRAGRNS